LAGMVQSYDELTMEMADEYGLNRLGEKDNDEDDEEEDDNDRGDATTHPTAAPPPVAMPPATAPEVIIIEKEDNPVEMVLEQEAPQELEIITPEAEDEPPQLCLFNVLMRYYEESPSRMMVNLDDLDDLTKADYDVDEWFLEDGSNDRD
jgi:hypothetical protein